MRKENEMIFRHFADSRTGGHSYLIASSTTRQAAIVNPSIDALSQYTKVIDELGLQLVATFLTDAEEARAAGVQALLGRYGGQAFAPAARPGSFDGFQVAQAGQSFSLGDIRVDFVAPPPGGAGRVAYQVPGYTFVGTSLTMDAAGIPAVNPRGDQPTCSSTGPSVSPKRVGDPRLANLAQDRSSIGAIPIERLIMEDLQASLAESVLTPKEARVAEVYIETMKERGLKAPSAAEMATRLPDVDRTALHVIVHNIRWKQIDLGRLPLQLEGQTSKWLRGLQTKPEFTSHEQEFLRAYFQLLQQRNRPPSGPEISETLGTNRSVQWVRKRAHTIRGKQREFKMPELILARKNHEKSEEEGNVDHKALPSPFRGRFDFEMRPQH
jgi:hypothetical protein